MSIWSYPERGHWGDAAWRGNSSGYLYRDLYRTLTPQSVVDPCMGSGTSIEVAREMGIAAIGLDLHSGFNLLRDSILETVKQPVDLVVSHFPYHDMIVYSGNQYPCSTELMKYDMSRCVDMDDFLDKSQLALLNQRDACIGGGHYATLIGDMRRNGKYFSFQAEFIARMPRDELRSVIIKTQHNCRSDHKTYVMGSGLPRIEHEYLLIWQRPQSTQCYVSLLRQVATQQATRVRSTWKSIVRLTLVSLGGEASLPEIYSKMQGLAAEKIPQNQHWKEKTRQVLQLHDCFVSVCKGRWALA